MELRDTPDEAAFRAEVRAFIAQNLPDDSKVRGARRFETADRDWSQKLGAAGYAGLTWPKEYGGAGAPYSHQAIFLEELARAEAPSHLGVIGLGMAGPTIIAWGTDAQKERYLVRFAVEQFRLADNAALKRKLNEVVSAGGEGLMLHLAAAPYITGRNDALLKLKPLNDTEATVIGYIPGKGKYTGMMGALQVEMADGKRFQIGTGFTDAVRAHPPAVGTLVTYTYRGLTKNGLPRFASFLRVREKF